VADAIPQGDTGAASAAGGGAPSASSDQQQTQQRQAAEGDTSGADRQQAMVPSGRLREEAARARAAEEKAREADARVAQLAQQLEVMRQERAADASVLGGMRKLFAPEPEAELPDDPALVRVASAEERLKKAEEYIAAQERQAQVTALQSRIEKATAKHPIPQYAIGTVVEAIRRYQQQGQQAPVEAIVKQVHEQIAADREEYRKSRDVPPAAGLMERVAPNLPEMPKSFKSTRQRIAWMEQNRPTRH
jgi:hypothetical protein